MMNNDSHQLTTQSGRSNIDLSSEQTEKLDTFIVKNYGIRQAALMKSENKERKDLLKSIIIMELRKTYKYPEAAYQALDFTGKGYVDVNDFINLKIMYRLPISKEELRELLLSETIFKKIPQLKIEVFTKFFFPHKTVSTQEINFSDSEDEEEKKSQKQNSPSFAIPSYKQQNSIPRSGIQGGVNEISDKLTDGTTSISMINKNREISNKIKELEVQLKEKLSNNWVSVKKAFLDIDTDYDGFITAENFASLLGGSSSSQKFDFSLLKMLIKLRTKNKESKVNYRDFCAWFGNVIEPVEGFYFRHDSQKNPQYEKNMQKQVQKFAEQQQKLNEQISSQQLKSKFINKLFSQYKTIKKAFIEMNKEKSGFISFDVFKSIMKSWGFDLSDDLIKELFNWVDNDKDQKLSYEDLRQTVGKETNPMEQLFFRQDVKPGKVITCKYDKCWENNQNNSKSNYCPLHQKILRNKCMDRFAQISSNIEDYKWEAIVKDLQSQNLEVTIKALNQILRKYVNYELTSKEKEAIWETFKIKENIEDNPDSIDDRMVSMVQFVNSKKANRLKRMNEIIQMEEEDENLQDDIKAKGLEQVGEDFVLKMSQKKLSNWGGIWKSIKQIDKDSNGFVTSIELEEIFREWFPLELEGKSLQNYFKKFRSIQNKQLINYKIIKEKINSILIANKNSNFSLDKSSFINDQSSLGEVANKNLNKSVIVTQKSQPILNQQNLQQIKTQINEDEDEELRIEGQSQFGQYSVNKSQFLDAIPRSVTPIRKRIPLKNNSSPKNPQKEQNILKRNESIQKLNNITSIEITNQMLNGQELSTILRNNNRSTTPITQRGRNQNYKSKIQNSNGIGLGAGPLSQISQSSAIKSSRFNEDVKTKLAYEWKNIFRGLTSIDLERKGTVNIQTFNKVIHQHKVYLSREELRKIENIYGTGENSALGQEIDYMKISQELGLHKQSLDYIKTKGKNYIDQISKVLENESRATTMKSREREINKIPLQNAISSRDYKGIDGNDSVGESYVKYNNNLKIKSAREFLENLDKTKTRQTSIQNFLKVARIFGLSINQNLIKGNENGLVDYENILSSLQ